METGDKVRLIDDSVLFAVAELRKGTEGVILYPTWVEAEFDEDETDGYLVEFTVNGELESYTVTESEVELIERAA